MTDTHHDHDQHGSHDHADPAARIVERRCDVAVIGGSAAGLAAALQLTRQRRTVIVVDDGAPRNAPAEHMHGYLGHDGAAPSELIEKGRAEVRSYGGEILPGRALAVRACEDGFRVELTGGHSLIARRVLAASGIADQLPAIDGLAEHWGTDVIHCPFCHGYEVRDRRLVQIITHPMGLHPTTVFRHLTDRLTVVLHEADGVDESVIEALTDSGVSVVRDRVTKILTGSGGSVSGVRLGSGDTLEADAVVVGPRFRGRADFLAPAGVTLTSHPSGLGELVAVDATGQTSVPGIYAAGNLTDPSLQVLPAAAHGSQVGAMIAFGLAEEDLHAGVRPSGTEGDWDHRYGGRDRIWSANPNGTLVREATGLPAGRALDVGAGEGADALWLAEHGWQVTASDISANALARLGAEADHRQLAVTRLRVDANQPEAFPTEAYDLVSLQYGSFLRTPEGRGLSNLLGAVAPGGTLLVVGHDLTALQEPLDMAAQTRMFDPGAYVGVDEIAAALTTGWSIETWETRPRPSGAASTHHVNDVVLRAVKL